MARHDLREKAHSMRKSGESIYAIANALSAPKSTVSNWCRDITLSKDQIEKLSNKQLLAGRRGSVRAAESKRAVRIAATAVSEEIGRKDVGVLSKRDHYIIGLSLYWGEGYKRGNEECGLTNSDPHILNAFVNWIVRSYGVKKSDLILRVTINEAHKSRSAAIEKHWAKAIGIPLSQFTKSSFISTKHVINRNPSEYFGTLRIKVRRGTALRRRILGSLSEIRGQITPQT